MPSQFTPQFYRRFYVDPRTRVTTQQEMYRRGFALAAIVKNLELRVARILDAGCGLGWMRTPLLEQFPRAAYVGLEVSEHLCEQLGWVNCSIADYRPRGQFDLIVCYDVLQYLTDAEARRALATMARLCRGALYFHAPTLEDWERNADRSRSDSSIHLRPAQWYRTRLARHFRHVGMGVHVRRNVPIHQWELERAV
jgi:trans-aconitate methyltransferase